MRGGAAHLRLNPTHGVAEDWLLVLEGVLDLTYGSVSVGLLLYPVDDVLGHPVVLALLLGPRFVLLLQDLVFQVGL
jgi:hypothetical protein